MHRFSLKWVMPVFVMVVSLVFAAVNYAHETQRARRDILDSQQQLASHAATQLASLIEERLGQTDWIDASHHLQSASVLPHLRWAALVGEDDRVLLSTEVELNGKRLSDLSTSAQQALALSVRGEGAGKTAMTAQGRKLRAVYPLSLPSLRSGVPAGHSGLLVLDFDNRPLLQKARQDALARASVTLGGGVSLALMALVFIHFYLVRRIEQLAHFLRSEQRAPDAMPKIAGGDEIAQLGQHFADMTRELAAQNRQLRAFFESSFQYVVLMTPDGTIIDLNELARAFVGSPLQHIAGRKIWDGPWMGGDVKAQDTVVADVAAAAQGQPVARTMSFVESTGECRLISYSVRPVQDASGRLEWLLCEAQDVTALKQEEAHRQRLNSFYATLRDLNSAIVRDESRQQLFNDVCNIIVMHGEFFGAYIGLVDEASRVVVPVAGAGVESTYMSSIRLSVDAETPEGRGPTGQAIRARCPYICNDFAADPCTVPWREQALAAGIRSTAVFPLREAGRVIGALILYSRDVDAFDADLTGLLGQLAEDISFALDGLLRQQQVRLSAQVFDSSRESITISDANWNLLNVNSGFTVNTGFTADDVLGRNLLELRGDLHEADNFRRLMQELETRGYWQGEVLSVRKTGERFPAFASISTVKNDDGKIANIITVTTDISERRAAQQQIETLAYYDSLTGLPNRSLFRDRLEQLVRNAPNRRQQIALLYIDIDHFKNINDSLGHPVGDDILKTVAQRLSEVLGGPDGLARFGGDDFVVVINDIDADQVAHVTEDLLEAFVEPFVVNGQAFNLRASAGIAIYPQDGRSFEELYQHADAAMYRAKELGRSRYHFYTNELNDRVTERLLLENALRSAIDNDELSLHFQPQIDVHTGKVAGMEALMRWHSAEFGEVSPAKFIPIAEESDLIVRLGEWAIDRACQQLRELQDAGLQLLPVSVNVSSRQFSGQIYDAIIAALARYDIGSGYLELEITESLLTENHETTLDILNCISQLGVRIAVDDFGTGYSNLAYLKKFPLNKLKIDQSFVREVVSKDEDRAIATAVVNLGHSLDLRVTAEGVETVAQLEELRVLGCDEVQGYLFSKPLPARELVAYLRKHRVREATV